VKGTETGRTLRGKVISPGAAFGYVIREEPITALGGEAPTLRPADVEREVARLDRAVLWVRATLESHVKEEHDPHDSDLDEILDAHLLMLDDHVFLDRVANRIHDDRVPADHAVEREFSRVANRLVVRGDPYLKARAEEIRDLCQSLRRALRNAEGDPKRQKLPRPPVIVSPCLGATAVLRARRANAVAFLTSSTALTSHGAILLRASGIPALGGVDVESAHLKTGTPVLVDATARSIVVRPTAQQRRSALELRSPVFGQGVKTAHPPQMIKLADGSTVRLLGNIDHPSQAGLCVEQRLSGIGLFRTEFMVLETGRVPTEDEQITRYESVLEQLGGLPVTIRTLDLGGDKTIAGLHQCTGPNPALGVRGLRRHILRHPDELKTQLRAILRAATGHRARVLLPMVTNAGDVLAARELLAAVKSDLVAGGVPFDDGVPVGAMIEVPAAALNIGEILPFVDFVSIGTNDLVQYLTAADRDNEEVLHYQEIATSGLEPVLRRVVEAAQSRDRQKDVSVCGELASTEEGARFLVGLGIRALSVSPAVAPVIRDALACADPR